MTIKRMQQRRDTAADWTSVDPILAEGEIGFETDTSKFKFGDGTTVWSVLPYVATNQAEFYANLAAFPVTGNATKEYVAIDTGKIYRWSGSAYVEISVDLANVLPATPPNLLLDGLYEQDATWWAGATTAGASQLSTEQAYLGTQSWKITGSRSHYPNVTAAGGTGSSGTGIIKGEIGGRLYRMSCRVWRKTGNTSSGFIRGRIRLLGNDGSTDTVNGQGPTDAVNQSDITVSTWFEYTTYFTVPMSGTHYPYVGIYPEFLVSGVDSADVFYLDNIRFEDLTNSPLEIQAPAPTGDRTTDSRALQGCSDLAQLYRGTVKLRAGTYAADVVTQALAVQPRFVGMGQDYTHWDGTLKFQGHGHSNAFSGGGWYDLDFVGSHAGSAAVELNAVTDVHWDRTRASGTYDTGIWFRNELSGDFTELCNGEMSFYSTVTTALKYTAPVAGWASFHKSGLTGGAVQQGAGPAVLIESLARPYNAPLTCGVWTSSATYPVIQHNGDAAANFYGNLTVEQTAVAALGAGTPIFFAGPINAYMGTGLSVSLGTLIQTLAGVQAVSGGSLTQLPLRGLHVPSKAATATSAGTLVMTIADAQVQEFTGSTTHTVRLPTTGVTAGMAYVVDNNSTGAVTVQSSGANTILAIPTTRLVVFIARVDTPTTANDWWVIGAPATTASGYTTLAMRDTNANLFADAFIAGATSTATAAGTTTLTVADTQVQVFTGTTTQTVLLPTTSVIAGQFYVICNQSSGAVTVQSSGANTVQTLAAGQVGVYFAQTNTPTTAAHWVAMATGSATGDATPTASTIAQRDGNANLLADVFIPTKTSTATAAGTTTLTIADTQIQEFTGSTTQTVRLPTTGVTAGMSYTIVNNSSGTVTVQSSGANTVFAVSTTRIVVFTARIDAPTTGNDWFVTSVSATSATGFTTALIRDSNANAFADAFISTSTSTATAAGTTTLTVADTQVQVFTGSTTQTVKLPTTSILAGQFYVICNQSSGAVTVQSSGANTIQVLASGEVGIYFAQQATPTTAAHWVPVSTPAGALTLSNKRITKRKVAPSITTTYTIDLAATDLYVIETQNANITNVTTTGTPDDGHTVAVRIKGDATPRTIAYDGAKIVSSGVATLLATTAASKVHQMILEYDATLGKMVCMAVDATGY